jgi:aminoglycoside phosphotransferase family enzyme/predicted kinase
MEPQALVPRVHETHVSTVVLIGDRALKFPKPLRTEFLDQSTPDKRRHACEEELRLNRRLSPDVYLGIGEVHEGNRVADWFLVMRRMPEQTRLSALVGTPGFEDAVRDVVRTVAAFHTAQPPSAYAASLATQEAVRALWTTKNIGQMQRFAGSMLDAAVLAEIEQLSCDYIDGRGPLFAERIAQGWARDGHGDLLADDIFVLPDGPRVLDCLAFDASLRCGDVLLDVAFLAMDLERLAGPAIVDVVLDRYTELTGEHHPRSLGHLFVAYRALVRAKVSCLQAEQGLDGAAERAVAFAAQCLRHLRRAQPLLVLVGGAPGTGKTTVAHALAEAASAASAGDVRDLTVISSDEVRKELAGVAAGTPLSATGELHAGAYTPEARARVYDEVLRRARLLLAHGESVVLDATWGSAAARTTAGELAAATHSRLVAVQCVLDPTVAAARVAARREASTQAPDASDATPEVALGLAASFEPWPEATVLDTGREATLVDGDVRSLVATWNG